MTHSNGNWMNDDQRSSVESDARLLHRYLESMLAIGWKRWHDIHESWTWYWWHNEDPDGFPIPVHVMYSPTDDEYFANVGQHGWTRAQNVEDMGGWWMKMETPKVERHPFT